LSGVGVISVPVDCSDRRGEVKCSLNAPTKLLIIRRSEDNKKFFSSSRLSLAGGDRGGIFCAAPREDDEELCESVKCEREGDGKIYNTAEACRRSNKIGNGKTSPRACPPPSDRRRHRLRGSLWRATHAADCDLQSDYKTAEAASSPSRSVN
jgi:hypothetical protein